MNLPPDARAIALVLSLAARGLRLHPCVPRAKTPLLRDWPILASCDADIIRGWAAEHSECNWGLACGPGSNVWVLDVDGDQGKAALRRLIEQHGKLPETLTSRTGKGGHLFWSYPRSTIRNSASKVGGVCARAAERSSIRASVRVCRSYRAPCTRSRLVGKPGRSPRPDTISRVPRYWRDQPWPAA
jgi:Bifunctional DNA primase/polymerase, N-terminal